MALKVIHIVGQRNPRHWVGECIEAAHEFVTGASRSEGSLMARDGGKFLWEYRWDDLALKVIHIVGQRNSRHWVDECMEAAP